MRIAVCWSSCVLSWSVHDKGCLELYSRFSVGAKLFIAIGWDNWINFIFLSKTATEDKNWKSHHLSIELLFVLCHNGRCYILVSFALILAHHSFLLCCLVSGHSQILCLPCILIKLESVMLWSALASQCTISTSILQLPCTFFFPSPRQETPLLANTNISLLWRIFLGISPHPSSVTKMAAFLVWMVGCAARCCHSTLVAIEKWRHGFTLLACGRILVAKWGDFLSQLRQCCVDAGSVLAVKKDQSIHFNKWKFIDLWFRN